MDCSETKNRIVEAQDDLLSPLDLAALRQHLEFCNACAGEKNRIEQAFSLVKAIPTFAPPAAVWKKIQASLREPKPLSWREKLQQSLENTREALLRFGPSYFAGAVSAALLFLLIWPVQSPEATNKLVDRTTRSPESKLQRVSSAVPEYEAGYPVRLMPVRPQDPRKQFHVRNGELWEVDQDQRPAVNFPVREVATPAGLKSRDF